MCAKTLIDNEKETFGNQHLLRVTAKKLLRHFSFTLMCIALTGHMGMPMRLDIAIYRVRNKSEYTF
jgi:hypothetical protein